MTVGFDIDDISKKNTINKSGRWIFGLNAINSEKKSNTLKSPYI